MKLLLVFLQHAVTNSGKLSRKENMSSKDSTYSHLNRPDDTKEDDKHYLPLNHDNGAVSKEKSARELKKSQFTSKEEYEKLNHSKVHVIT